MKIEKKIKNQDLYNFQYFFLYNTGIVPIPSEQPTGCRADTQIVCPDLKTRICEVERCDGVENCPKNPNEEKSWDELGCISFTNVTFEPPKPTTTASTTSTTITFPRKGPFLYYTSTFRYFF